MQLHASCVSLDGTGVLIIGAAQTGKSSLCIDLIGRGAQLVSDDRTNLEVENETLVASSPDNLRGLIEIYGVGVVQSPVIVDACKVAFQVQLEDEIERLPESMKTARYEAIELPLIYQPARDASVAAKIIFLAQIFQQTGRIDTVSVANVA